MLTYFKKWSISWVSYFWDHSLSTIVLRLIKGELLYLPTQIRFPIGGECITVMSWVKLTNSLRKQQLKISTGTWSGRAPWSRGKSVSQPAYSKRFLRSFFYFWIQRYNKTQMTSSAGNREFYFSSTSNIESLEETKFNGARGSLLSKKLPS